MCLLEITGASLLDGEKEFIYCSLDNFRIEKSLSYLDGLGAGGRVFAGWHACSFGRSTGIMRTGKSSENRSVFFEQEGEVQAFGGLAHLRSKP